MSVGSSLSPAAARKAAEATTLPAPVISPATSMPSMSSRCPLWEVPSRRGGLKDYLMTTVDPERSTIPLAAYCFMTGWMCAAFNPVSFLIVICLLSISSHSSAVSFSAVFVWCAFQTGNSLQVRPLSPAPYLRISGVFIALKNVSYFDGTM
jgi:hypothetical protein